MAKTVQKRGWQPRNNGNAKLRRQNPGAPGEEKTENTLDRDKTLSAETGRPTHVRRSPILWAAGLDLISHFGPCQKKRGSSHARLGIRKIRNGPRVSEEHVQLEGASVRRFPSKRGVNITQGVLFLRLDPQKRLWSFMVPFKTTKKRNPRKKTGAFPFLEIPQEMTIIATWRNIRVCLNN